MKRFRSLIAFAGLALALSGCAALDNLVHGDLPAAAASVGDTLVTPAVHAPIANSAAAAENLYSGAQEILTASLKNRAMTAAQGHVLDPYIDSVFKIVTQLSAVQHGQDVTVLLKTFNVAYANLFAAAHSAGVTLPTAIPSDPSPTTAGATP